MQTHARLLLAVMAACALISEAIAQTVVDDFSAGDTQTTVSATTPNLADVKFGSSNDPAINSILSGSDNTRSWSLYGEAVASGSLTIVPGASVVLNGYGSWSLNYGFSASLSGYSGITVLGSGTATNSHFEIGIIDSDGDYFAAKPAAVGALGSISVPFASMSLLAGSGDGQLDLSQVVGLSVLGFIGSGDFSPNSPRVDGSMNYAMSSIQLSPVPEPEAAVMMLSGLLLVGGIARARRR